MQPPTKFGVHDFLPWCHKQFRAFAKETSSIYIIEEVEGRIGSIGAGTGPYGEGGSRHSATAVDMARVLVGATRCLNPRITATFDIFRRPTSRAQRAQSILF